MNRKLLIACPALCLLVARCHLLGQRPEWLPARLRALAAAPNYCTPAVNICFRTGGRPVSSVNNHWEV